MATRTGPDYKLTFVPEITPAAWKDAVRLFCSFFYLVCREQQRSSTPFFAGGVSAESLSSGRLMLPPPSFSSARAFFPLELSPVLLFCCRFMAADTFLFVRLFVPFYVCSPSPIAAQGVRAAAGGQQR